MVSRMLQPPSSYGLGHPDIELPLTANAPYDGEQVIEDFGQLPECVVVPTRS